MELIERAKIEDNSGGGEVKAYRTLLKWIDYQYPQIGISFGYTGNIGQGYGTYEDCSWFYFTKVWDHRRQRTYDNCHSYFVGQSLNMEQLVIEGDLSYLGNSLVSWINHTVLPDLDKPCTRNLKRQQMGW